MMNRTNSSNSSIQFEGSKHQLVLDDNDWIPKWPIRMIQNQLQPNIDYIQRDEAEHSKRSEEYIQRNLDQELSYRIIIELKRPIRVHFLKLKNYYSEKVKIELFSGTDSHSQHPFFVREYLLMPDHGETFRGGEDRFEIQIPRETSGTTSRIIITGTQIHRSWKSIRIGNIEVIERDYAEQKFDDLFKCQKLIRDETRSKSVRRIPRYVEKAASEISERVERLANWKNIIDGSFEHLAVLESRIKRDQEEESWN